MELASCSLACKAAENPCANQTNTVDGATTYRSIREDLCESPRCALRSHRIEATSDAEDSDLSTSSLDCDMTLDVVRNRCFSFDKWHC